MQGISYGGTQEIATNSDKLENSGNFLAIFWKVAHCCPLLYEHIHLTLRKDMSYMSLTSQNELIDNDSKFIIQKRFTEDIKEAKYHSVSTDKVPNSYVEMLSICIGHMDKD